MQFIKGCFADKREAPAFLSMIPLRKVFSSFETINLCQRIAAKNGAVYYALQNGIECHFGPSNSSYSKYGKSSDCDSVCGYDDSPHALNCGGVSSNTVYQLSV